MVLGLGDQVRPDALLERLGSAAFRSVCCRIPTESEPLYSAKQSRLDWRN